MAVYKVRPLSGTSRNEYFMPDKYFISCSKASAWILFAVCHLNHNRAATS